MNVNIVPDSSSHIHINCIMTSTELGELATGRALDPSYGAVSDSEEHIDLDFENESLEQSVPARDPAGAPAFSFLIIDMWRNCEHPGTLDTVKAHRIRASESVKTRLSFVSDSNDQPADAPPAPRHSPKGTDPTEAFKRNFSQKLSLVLDGTPMGAEDDELAVRSTLGPDSDKSFYGAFAFFKMAVIVAVGVCTALISFSVDWAVKGLLLLRTDSQPYLT